MNFDSLLGKLKYLENILSQDKEKYINKYDALSLSMINFEENNSNYALNMPKMDGLRKLVHELNDILTEGYIAQQVKIVEIKTEIGEANTLWNNIIQTSNDNRNEVMNKINRDVLENNEKMIDFNELSLIITKNSNINTELIRQVKTLEKQLKPILSNLYNQITRMIDNKLEMLQTMNQISEIYTDSIISIAHTHGVLEVNKKSNIVILPLFDPLIKHRLFHTNEEQYLLNLICEMWSSIVFHCKDHTLLASQQLSLEYHTTTTNYNQFFYYGRIGGTIILLLWAISECFNNETSEREIWNDQTFSIFMCFGDLLLLLVMWGVSIHVWRNAGIDYIRLLELEGTEIANEKTPEITVYSSSSNLSILFLVSFILFNKAVRGGYFAHSNLTLAHTIPAILVLFCTLRVFLPFNTRKQWLFMLVRVLFAPCFQINFRDGYIGDLLTSLVRVLIPLSFSFIYVFVIIYAWLSNNIELTVTTSDNWWTSSVFHKSYLVPFFTLLPLWLRLMQCLRRSVESGKRWPHMGNALKYTSAIIVISYGTFQPSVRHNSIWILAFVFATLFQFTWDLTQDWGLIIFIPPRITNTSISNSSGIDFIDYLIGSSISFRKTRLLGSLKLYYLVILFNFILRFSWTLTLLPSPIDIGDTHTLYVSLVTHISPLLASLEIIRRMVWGFFRLEYEQLEKLNKSENLLSETNKDVFMKFDKMEISSSIEMQSMEINSFTRSESANSYNNFHILYNEFDWSIYLPLFAQVSINHMTHALRLSTYQSKLRLIESVLFSLTVVYIIYTATIP